MNGDQQDNKEELKLEEQMRNQGKGDEEIKSVKNYTLCERLIKHHVLGILPNICKTGIVEVDEPKKEEDDPFAAFSLKNLNNLMNMFDEKKPEFFKNYFQGAKIENIQEIYDPDSYFSLAQGDEDVNEGPVASLLPHLLSSIYFITDEQLERRCLSVIMRIFNQREELHQNIQNLQIIFDPSKTQLFELLKYSQKRLQQLVDRSEIWLTDFLKKTSQTNKEFDETLAIIKNLRFAFYHNIRIEDNEIKLNQPEINSKIDEQKQSIASSLQVHEQLISLIKDQFSHYIECISNPKFPKDMKIKISTLFQGAFTFLRNFCRGNHNNQLLLHESLSIFTSYLQYNIGQIQLICEIFKDNHKLLTTKIDDQFLQTFVQLIEQYGRQEQFLEIFLTLIRYREKYLFDNQLLILNIFLSNQRNNLNHRLLFALPAAKEQFEFSFEGQISLIENDLLTDLQFDVDIHRDQPYYYHRKLLELLLSTTLIQAEKAVYQINQDDVQLRENFTISVAKLKKTFKASYILNLLQQPDQLTGNEPNQKSQARMKNIFKPGQSAQKEEEKGQKDQKDTPRTLEKKRKSKDMAEEMKKKGMILLKKQLCQFYRLVHIASEKSHVADSELTIEFTHFVDCESRRFEKINLQENLNRYMDYLFEGLLPLLISYFERVIAPHQQFNQDEGDIQDGEEQKDLETLNSFVTALCKKIDQHLYKAMTQKRQVLILQKFLSQYPNINIACLMIKLFDSSNSVHLDPTDDEVELNNEMKSKLLNLLGEAETEPLNQFQLQNNPQTQIIPSMSQSPLHPESQANQEEQPLLNGPPKTIFNMNVTNMQMDAQDNHDNIPLNKEVKDALLKQGVTIQHKATAFFTLISKKPKKNFQIDVQREDGGLTEEQAIDIERLWYDFRSAFCNAKCIEEEIERETEILSEALIYINHFVPSDKSKIIEVKLELKLIAKQFINFLQYAVNNTKNKSTIITLLKVLRKIIQKEENIENKRVMQDMFNKLGATRMTLLVLSESNSFLDSETYRHFIMFINMLLEEGNVKVQKTIYEFFTSYQKSEVIFQRFNQVIQKQIESITLKAKEKKHRLQQIQEQMLDEDQLEEGMTEQEILQSQEDEKVMNQVLKFLQNCVEGHYLELQNYIRQQTSSRNSYNMINLVADLLKAYYYEDRSQQMYDNMIRCLDTLNELVQGPCLENQIAVSESKFFEIASDLFSQRKDKEKQGSMSQSNVTMSNKNKTSRTLNMSSKTSVSRKGGNRGDDLTDWMINRLQMKCLILILSLIEMRELSESNPIIKRIMRNLPMNLLQRHMVKTYKKYIAIYGHQYVMEVFDHVKNDPRDIDEKEMLLLVPNYFETIIQTGFYIFFLMNYYMECDPHMDNQFVQMYRAYRKKQLKISKGGLEDILLGDNIIGQLVSFAMGLVQQGLDIANTLKQHTYDKMMKKDQLTPEQIERIEREKQAHKKKILKESFEFFISNSATIEVIRNDNIEIVFFMKLPFAHDLPKEKKVEFHDAVDRGSTKSKVQGLVDVSSRLIEICQHEYKLKQFFTQQKFLALFANYVKLWKDLAFLFTLLLNLFIIGSFSDKYGDRMLEYHLFQSDQYSTTDTKSIFLICGIVMTCCSIFVVMFFLCKNAPLIIRKAWNEKTPFEGPNQGLIMWFIVIFVKLLTVLIFILKEIEVIYYLAYGALAIIGTIVHPFFFSFHLTEILIRYPTLKNVIKAVWEPRQQLFLTLILFIILVYVYGLVAYTFFSSDYDGRCESALFCFLFTFDWTFKANGGVGGYLTDLEDPDKAQKYEWARFVFDNTSNIILVIIMVNIVAGIIIDTFGSLREAENEKNRDIEDKCFICGNLKTTFDRLSDNAAGGGFNYHIKINHYMWNYMFFMAYLQEKDPTEYTGIEQYVADKIIKQDLMWFPFNKARELKGLDEDEEEETGRVNKIQQDMQIILENMEKTSQTLAQIRMQKHKTIQQ